MKLALGISMASCDGCEVVTSAPAAPVTWNPSDAGPNTTFSNGNLTITGTGGSASFTRATTSIPAGRKVYWELINTAIDRIAVADAAASLTADWGYGQVSPGPANPDACCWDDNAGGICYNGALTGASVVGATYIAGPLQIAVDTTGAHPIVWFGCNNNWVNGTPGVSGGTTMGGASMPVYPGASPSNGHNITARFLAAAWTGTPPSGFGAI